MRYDKIIYDERYKEKGNSNPFSGYDFGMIMLKKEESEQIKRDF